MHNAFWYLQVLHYMSTLYIYRSTDFFFTTITLHRKDIPKYRPRYNKPNVLKSFFSDAIFPSKSWLLLAMPVNSEMQRWEYRDIDTFINTPPLQIDFWSREWAVTRGNSHKYKWTSSSLIRKDTVSKLISIHIIVNDIEFHLHSTYSIRQQSQTCGPNNCDLSGQRHEYVKLSVVISSHMCIFFCHQI